LKVEKKRIILGKTPGDIGPIKGIGIIIKPRKSRGEGEVKIDLKETT